MRKFQVALAILMSVTLCGCSILDRLKNDPKKIESANAEKIFEYIKDEDTDALCGLFAEYVQDTHDLEAEWEAFFDAIDGTPVSYSSLSFPGEGYETDPDGNVIDSHLSVNYNGVKTDTGETYDEFGYLIYQAYAVDPSQGGLSNFCVYLADSDEWVTVGDS